MLLEDIILPKSLLHFLLFMCLFLDSPKRHTSQLKKIQHRLNFLQHAQYCTVKACTTHKINPASQLCTLFLTTEDQPPIANSTFMTTLYFVCRVLSWKLFFNFSVSHCHYQIMCSFCQILFLICSFFLVLLGMVM